jgi:hypothetical protein
VTSLAFRHDLYSGFAVDAAAKAFAEFASIERVEEPDRFVLKITATGEVDEATLCGEIGNYALGATVERRGPEGSLP